MPTYPAGQCLNHPADRVLPRRPGTRRHGISGCFRLIKLNLYPLHLNLGPLDLQPLLAILLLAERRWSLAANLFNFGQFGFRLFHRQPGVSQVQFQQFKL
jgi:hypothetical protein